MLAAIVAFSWPAELKILPKCGRSDVIVIVALVGSRAGIVRLVGDLGLFQTRYGVESELSTDMLTWS